MADGSALLGALDAVPSYDKEKYMVTGQGAKFAKGDLLQGGHNITLGSKVQPFILPPISLIPFSIEDSCVQKCRAGLENVVHYTGSSRGSAGGWWFPVLPATMHPKQSSSAGQNSRERDPNPEP